MTAANVDKSWIGTNIEQTLAASTGCKVVAVNDADAAGVAEMVYGAGRGQHGVVLMTTFGTGIGTAVFLHGQLLPNTEFGHIEIDGKDAEKGASELVREKKHLSWSKWAKRVDRYLRRLEALFAPDIIIIGGGASRKADKFIPLLKLRATVVPATLQNDAGIVGAAVVAGLGGRHPQRRPARDQVAAWQARGHEASHQTGDQEGGSDRSPATTTSVAKRAPVKRASTRAASGATASAADGCQTTGGQARSSEESDQLTRRTQWTANPANPTGVSRRLAIPFMARLWSHRTIQEATVRELRAIRVSDDGKQILLTETTGTQGADAPPEAAFHLPADDRLRAMLRPRPTTTENRPESALTPREIQARLRAGETAEEVAEAAGIPVARVARYEAPIAAERVRIVDEVRRATAPGPHRVSPGRQLGAVVDDRLAEDGLDPVMAQWLARRRPDGTWLVTVDLADHHAEWSWDSAGPSGACP